jgi:menaquinone-dependent protoporphyrinogen IX oxidase
VKGQTTHIVKIVEYHLISKGTDCHLQTSCRKQKAHEEKLFVLGVEVQKDNHYQVSNVTKVSHIVVPAFLFVHVPLKQDLASENK